MNNSHRILGRIGAALLGIASLGAVWLAAANADEAARAVPLPIVDTKTTGPGLETAVLAGGCFWGVEGVFQHVKGVKEVLAGYSGGSKATASYPIVGNRDDGGTRNPCRSNSIRARFHMAKSCASISPWAHDPTELNRQGPGQRAELSLQYLRGPMPNRNASPRPISPRPISPSSTRRMSSRSPSSPASIR